MSVIYRTSQPKKLASFTEKKDISPLDNLENYGDVVVHWGRFSKGKRVAELDLNSLQFYATNGQTPEDLRLSAACVRMLEEINAQKESIIEEAVYEENQIEQARASDKAGIPENITNILHTVQDFINDDESVGLFGDVPIPAMHKDNFWIYYSAIKDVKNVEQAKRVFWEGTPKSLTTTVAMTEGSQFHDAFLLGHKKNIAPKILAASNKLKDDALRGTYGEEMQQIALGGSLNECAFRVGTGREDFPCQMVGKFDTMPFSGNTLIDIKTCSQLVSEDAFQKTVKSYGYHIQAALYLLACRNLGLTQYTKFAWLFVERDTGRARLVKCSGGLEIRGECHIQKAFDYIQEAFESDK